MSTKSPSTPQQPREDQQDSTNNKYAAEIIVAHNDKDRDTKYVFWWYDYSAKNDTVEPADLIPNHLIQRYQQRVNNTN